MSFETNIALCWTCQKACGGCSWSNSLIPVEGWTAEEFPNDIKLMKKDSTGYLVIACPEYVADEPRREI